MTEAERILGTKFYVEEHLFKDSEEGICAAIEYYTHRTHYPTPIILAMQEYAELYAKRCLEIAADNAEVFEEGFYNRNDDEDTRWSVDKQSITGIKLPEHI